MNLSRNKFEVPKDLERKIRIRKASLAAGTGLFTSAVNGVHTSSNPFQPATLSEPAANSNSRVRTVPAFSSHITDESNCCYLSVKIYKKMLQDYEVQASLAPVISAATSYIGKIRPNKFAHLSPEEIEQQKIIIDYLQCVVNDIPQGMKTFQRQLVHGGLAFGTALSEITYGTLDGTGEFKDLTGIKALKTVDLEDVVLSVDNCDEVVGVVPRFILGNYGMVSNPTSNGTSIIPLTPNQEAIYLKGVVPRDRYIMFTWGRESGDPRGKSLLTAAYKVWDKKWSTIDKLCQWMDRFSVPSVIGTLGEFAAPKCEEDEEGNLINCSNPAEDFLKTLEKFQSNSTLVKPFGYEVENFQVSGSADEFLKVIQWADKSIARAILGQNLATQEGEHMARASGETHQDILTLFILCVKTTLSDVIKRDLFLPLIQKHFPTYQHLCPNYDLGQGRGFPLTPNEISLLMQSGLISEAQLPMIDETLQLPDRSGADNAN